jgi:hypothetical protein
MKKYIISIIALLFIQLVVKSQAITPFSVKSPSNHVVLIFTFTEDGTPVYAITYKGKAGDQG